MATFIASPRTREGIRRARLRATFLSQAEVETPRTLLWARRRRSRVGEARRSIRANMPARGHIALILEITEIENPVEAAKAHFRSKTDFIGPIAWIARCTVVEFGIQRIRAWIRHGNHHALVAVAA